MSLHMLQFLAVLPALAISRLYVRAVHLIRILQN